MSKTPDMLSAIEPWDLVANGYAEIYRTLKPGGSIAVTSWAVLVSCSEEEHALSNISLQGIAKYLGQMAYCPLRVSAIAFGP